MSCTLEQVPQVKNTKTGELVDSRLYNDFKAITGNEMQALYLWSNIHNKSFMDEHWGNLIKDENGEPLISNFRIKNPYTNRVEPVVKPHNVKSPGVDKIKAMGLNEAIDSDGKYLDVVTKDDNRRWVVNNFFRYDEKNGKSYYPFNTNDDAENYKLEQTINSSFDRPVVKINPTTGNIEFRTDSNLALFKSEDPDFVYSLAEKGQEVTTPTGDVNVFDYVSEADKNPRMKMEDFRKRQQEYIDFKKDQLRILTSHLTEKGMRKKDIQVQIDKIQNELDRLKEGSELDKNNVILNSIFNTIDLISNDLGRIGTALEPTASPDMILRTTDRLIEISYYIRGLKDFPQFVKYDTPEEKEMIDRYVGLINDAEKTYLEHLKHAFLFYANQQSYRTDFTEKIFDPIADLNMMKAHTLGLHEATNSEVAQVLDDILQMGSNHIDNEFAARRNEIETQVKELEKNYGMSGQKLWDKFLQHDKNGEWTKNYVGRIRQEYFDIRRELFNRARDTTDAFSWKDYWKWVKKNTLFPTIEELNSGKSSRFTEEKWSHQIDLLNKYEEEKAAYREAVLFDGEYTDMDGNFKSAKAEKLFNARIKSWELTNSPFVWLDKMKKDADVSQQLGRRFLLTKEATEPWEDEQYKEIMANEHLKKFYDFMRSTFEENNTWMPYVPGLPENYLPEQQRSFLENIKSAGALKLFGPVRKEIRDAITEDADRAINRRVVIAGKEVKSIPHRMMGNKLPVEEKSKDIPLILLKHTKMGIAYKHKTQMEPIANAALEILRDQEETEEIKARHSAHGNMDNKKGIPKKDAYGNIISHKNQLHNLITLVQYTIDSNLYDERTKQGEGRLNRYILSPEEKARRKALKEQLDKKEITEDEYDNELLQMGKEVTLGAIANTMLKYTYVRALSIPNVITPIVNVLFGMVSDFGYAVGEDVDQKSMAKGVATILKATSRHIGKKFFPETVKKVYGILDMLNVLADINETHYGSKTSVLDKAVILQSKAEYINQGSMALAIFMYAKVKDKNGKDTSLWDAYKYDENSNKMVWDEDRMGKEIPPKRTEILGEHGVNMFRLIQKIKYINYMLHGDYFNPILGKKTIVGRMMFLFKSWLPMSLMYRFGEERYSKELQRWVKGRYRSLINSTTLEGEELPFYRVLGKLATAIFKGKKSLNDLSEVDRVNLLRDIKEINYLASSALVMGGLYLVLGSLGGAAGDDRRRRMERITLTLLMNSISKSQADMALYINPASAGQIVDNLVPLYQTLKDMTINLWIPLVDTISGQPLYSGGYFKGQPRLLHWGFSVTPGLSGAMRLYSQSQKVINYNTANY